MKQGYIIKTSGLEVYYDASILEDIERRLGKLKDQKYVVLKNAINDTLNDTKTALIDKAQEEYTVKKGPLKKATTTKKATTSKLDGEIDVKGTTQDLKSFKTRSPKSGTKAQVLTSSTLKLIQSSKGSRAKAFLAEFSNGKDAIVQRQDGESYTQEKYITRRKEMWGSGADMTKIKKLLSTSFPKMVGGEEVYGYIAPDVLYYRLPENISKEIAKVVNT